MPSPEDTIGASSIDSYKDSNVLRAIASSSWLTPQYIINIHDLEPDPPRHGLEGFYDEALNVFFEKQLNLDKGNQVYAGVRTYVARQMITPDGHPLLLGKIAFTDDNILKLAQELGTDSNHEFDRGMIGDVDNGLMAIIAPESIRKPVVKVTHSWGTDTVKQDAILWSQLVKNGAQAYLKRGKP